MNKRMVEGINQYMDEIIERWQLSMKEEKGERFFHFMPTNLIDKTSREFAELMTSNIADSDNINSEKLSDFTGKVVRFGWSIKIVNRAIENFSQITFGVLEEKGVIEEVIYELFLDLFSELD